MLQQHWKIAHVDRWKNWKLVNNHLLRAKDLLMFKRITQDDSTGCGLACVATLARTSYQKIKAQAYEILSGWPNAPRSLYTDILHIKALLNANDIAHGNYRHEKNWAKVKTNIAIAAINLNERNNWHWIVYYRDGDDAYLLDPRAKNEKRRDFGRAHLHAYLPIYITATSTKK